jgi:hypothetical protein
MSNYPEDVSWISNHELWLLWCCFLFRVCIINEAIALLITLKIFLRNTGTYLPSYMTLHSSQKLF